MSLPRGYAFEGEGEEVRAVPVVDPVYHDDAETAAPPRDFETYAERLLSVLEGPPKTSAARVAALRRIMGRDARPLRAIAGEIGCSISTLHDAIRAAEAKLFSTPANTLSEEK
jgi:hypothetical protein